MIALSIGLWLSVLVNVFRLTIEYSVVGYEQFLKDPTESQKKEAIIVCIGKLLLTTLLSTTINSKEILKYSCTLDPRFEYLKQSETTCSYLLLHQKYQ